MKNPFWELSPHLYPAKRGRISGLRFSPSAKSDDRNTSALCRLPHLRLFPMVRPLGTDRLLRLRRGGEGKGGWFGGGHNFLRGLILGGQF